MKLGLVILNAEPERGGAERYTLDLAAALAGMGHDVSVLASRFARDIEPAKRVQLQGAAGGRVARYLNFTQSLQEHLKTNHYDVVHAMLPVPGCDVYHPHAGIEAHNLQTSHLRHDSPFRQVMTKLGNHLNRKRRLYARMERLTLEETGADVLCLSQAMQQIAEQHYNLREGQSHVLINGVNLAAYDPSSRPEIRQQTREQLGLHEDDIAALLMANNYRLKGLKQAIECLAELVAAGNKRAKLIVVGREAVDPYRRLAERLGIGQHLAFVGATTDPHAFYAASDLFVLPTAYDSCSLVVLEALAMGKPVITTRKNGAAEAYVDGVQGFVIDDQADTEGLTEAWSNLINDSLRQKMDQAAMKLREDLSREKHLQRLLDIYAAVMQRKRSGT